MISIGVVVPCHNEESYIRRSLTALRESLEESEAAYRVLVVLDRCSDSSKLVFDSFVKENPSLHFECYEKASGSWKNSYAENLELGNEFFENAGGIDLFSVIDADMVVPVRFFRSVVEVLLRDEEVVSVSSVVYAEPSTAYNQMYHGYEKLMERVRFNKRLRRHGNRVWRETALRSLSRTADSAGFRDGKVFSDVLAPDSQMDRQLKGRVEVLDMVTLHIRHTGLRRSLRSQLRQGRAMREVGSPPKPVLKEIARLRPLVFCSYLIAGRN